MKKMKKIMSLLLAFVLVMSLSLTAFAAGETGTLTVKGENLSGKKSTVVRMFKTEGNSTSYVMENQWQDFFNTQLSKGESQNATSEEAYAYVNAMNGDDEKVINFAKAAKVFCYSNGTLKPEFNDLSKTVTADSNNTATFAELPVGYYLVLPEGGSNSGSRHTDAVLKNVTFQGPNTVQLKSEYPTVVKTVNDETSHGNSAQIGDEVSFTLTSKVPDMTEYGTYKFIFRDTMSKGLTLNENSIKVTIASRNLNKGTDYTVSVNTSFPENTVLEIGFNNLKTVEGINVGDAIKVTYSATLNENAQIGTNPNTNVAEVEYSNKPGTEETGKSNPSETKTYSFDIKVHKYANDDKATILPGAVFELRDSEGQQPIQLVKEEDYAFHVATPAEIADGSVTKVTQFTTVDGNDIDIKGLEEGTYKLYEVSAPAGYNKLVNDVTIKITADYEDNGSLQAGTAKYTVNGGTPSTDNIIEVQNRTGTSLPETGSIGTIGLTVLGVILVVAGLGFTSRKKKEQE